MPAAIGMRGARAFQHALATEPALDPLCVDAHWRLDREGWRALPDDGVLELQRLPAGSHRLQVQVAVDGVYSDALDLPLLQLPRWHERTVTWWIAALAALLGGGLLWRWRMHALLRRNEQLERTVQQRSEASVGERRRALEAEAAQRGAEQALHLRRLTAAQATYAELQPRERLLLAALAQAPADVATLAQCLAAQAHALGAWPPAEVAATLHRLAERGLVAAVGGGWRLADADLALLPDLALPLPELAVRHARRVGAYRLLERIGVGGSGEVYRARSIDGAEEVALKLLHADPALRADAVRRHDREWDTVARLRHPNIVRMCERGEHDGRLYLAMELVRGCTLAQRLDAEGALPEEQARSILRQLLAALSALHGAGVAHRDLNPNNIMLEHGGRVVLLDFGLARGHRHSTLTQPQTLLGTLPYIAPELLRGGEAGTPADLWSLGVVAAELRLGRLPWRADSSIEMAVEVGRFHAWSQYPPITDARWNALVESMLRADPGARIGAVELGQRLDVC
ncbi:MAG: Serine/threonine-protein kinase PknD [Xanthomonadales bacterium]|nr:Serine/threonine-protein kinase PknD [Xanthomonadales bacterium]